MLALLSLLNSTDFSVLAACLFLLMLAKNFDEARSRRASRRLERKLDLLLDHAGLKLPTKLSLEVQEIARNPRQKIAAIKLHREQTGIGLAQAKAEVEEFGA